MTIKNKFVLLIFTKSMREFPADFTRFCSSPRNVGDVEEMNYSKKLNPTNSCRIMEYDGDAPRPGTHDDMIITLLRTNQEIQTYFKHTGHLLPNEVSGNLRIEVDCSTLAYFDWLTNVKVNFRNFKLIRFK